MLAVVSATLSSVSPILAAGSRDRSTTAPIDSPSAMIGQMTCAVYAYASSSLVTGTRRVPLPRLAVTT